MTFPEASVASTHFVLFADAADSDRNERRKNSAIGTGPSPLGRNVCIRSTIERGGYRTEKCSEGFKRIGDSGHQKLVVPTAKLSDSSTPSDRDKM